MTLHRTIPVAILVLTSLADPRLARADDPGLALRFDGVSDLVRLTSTGSTLSAGWQTTKTVSLWVMPTGTAGCTGAFANTCDVIFGDRPRTWGISRGTLSGADRIWVWNYDGTTDQIEIEYTVGQWTHIALVHGGGLLKAYKNGSLVGSVPSGPTPAAGALGMLHIGGIIKDASSNWTFAGEIDEVQIWNGARTDAEILQDAYRVLAGSESGLAAYYRMSNGSGTTLTDDSGHMLTGTLTDGGSGVPPDGPIAWVPSGAFGAGGGPPSTNSAPVADPQNLTTPEDTDLQIVLTGSDADNDPLTYRVVSQPSHGSLTEGVLHLTYTPGLNYHGADSFTFVVNDGYVDSAVQTVSISITPVNDRPVAMDDTARTTQDTAVVISVLDNDTDVDGDSLTIAEVGTPGRGSVTWDVIRITYAPQPGYTGVDTFTYTIADGNGGVATGQVTVTIRLPGADPGYALRFDGVSDFVTLNHTSSILPGGWQSTKTVEVWVKPTGTYTCTPPASPMSCSAIFGDRPRWWGISRGPYNGLDRIWVWNWDGNLDAIGITYSPDEWVHVALVHAGGTLMAYKNGALVGAVASGPTQQPLTGALPMLQLGGVINSATRNWAFRGELDEVRIWSTARTAQELLDNVNRPLAGFEPGLAAYYSMSDGSGLLLTDDSGRGWAGKLWDGIGSVPPDGPITWVPSGAFSAR